MTINRDTLRQMSFAEFQASIGSGKTVPSGLSAPLRALWLDRFGDWAAAHGAVQNESTSEAAWVHAYLHRKEGDDANARYWYRQAGRTPPSETDLDSEWARIAAALLDNTAGAAGA